MRRSVLPEDFGRACRSEDRSLCADGEVRALDQGEIQFTDYGISGIPVFQISRFAAKALSEGTIEVRAELDFMPDFTKEQLKKFPFCHGFR
ncbi:MAG: hypothetical protein ACLUUO_15360 [Sellimonas intestinalis]